jgi:hypothetical protein
MAEKVTEWFDAVMSFTSRFVESQRGTWDNAAWMNFLDGLQKKGFELTDAMKSYTGPVLESMKKIYDTSLQTKGMQRSLSDISEHTVSFMKTTKGIWDQNGWESFLKDLQTKGVALTDETRNYIAGILAAARDLYSVTPTAASEEAAEKKEAGQS